MSKLLRSDHRIIHEILAKSGKGGLHHNQEVYNKIGLAFERSGGSWESLVHGCPQNTDRLKNIIKAAIKNNWFTAPQFMTRNKKVKDEE